MMSESDAKRPRAGRPLYWLDVFTDRPLAGNGLAVVLSADGLETETMLGFAREVGLSETTFVQAPDRDGADYLNRIWTIAGEIPFAGHPSLGTAVAVALERGLERADFTQQTGVGLQTVEVRAEGPFWRVSMRQPPAEFGPIVSRERIGPGLGLSRDQLDPELSPQIVSTGLAALLVPLNDREALAACVPDFELIAQLDSRTSLNTYPFVYERGSRTIRARCFGADLAGIEDPATGSAAGPLLAYLQDCLDIDRVVIEQGIEMGRPSRIEARMVDGCPVVSGAATVVARGTTYLS